MKKLRTLFAATAILVATSAFATPGPDKVSERVKNEFEKFFAGAANVKWEVKDDFYFATFDLNAKEVNAAYNPEQWKQVSCHLVFRLQWHKIIPATLWQKL
jgi:hypothetical protein